VPNQGGPRGSVTNRIVVHIMQGSLVGCDSWFHNPASQVSAHFGVGKQGEVYQWVDTDETAWAEAAYNQTSISIEHEGMTGETLTPSQLKASIALQEWILDTYPRIPAAFTMDPAHEGIIGHGQLGVLGGNHPQCPGLPILKQMAAAYRPHPKPAPEPPEDEPQVPPVQAKPPRKPGPLAPQRGTQPMQVAVPKVPTKQSAASTVRQSGGLVGLVAGFTGNLPSVPHVSPTAVFLVTTIGSMVLFIVEHFVGDPSTGATAVGGTTVAGDPTTLP
jgi:hypothetical protein